MLSTCIQVIKQAQPSESKFTLLALFYNSPEINGGFGLHLGM
jgi:hypothetical protein